MAQKFLVVMHMEQDHKTLSKDEMVALLSRHGGRLAKQEKEGLFLYGGPALDKTVAILVYKGSCVEEVEQIVKQDPLYLNGLVTVDVHPFVTLDDLLASKEALGQLVESMV